MANNIYHYYVEGDDEKKVIDTLKTSMQLIISGKVDVFNVIERKFTRNQIMRLKQGTIVVLVFDTDTNQVDTLLAVSYTHLDVYKRQILHSRF